MLIVAAFLLDAVLGDPRWLPHPVVWMGKLIAALESRLNIPGFKPGTLVWRGLFLTTTVLAAVYFGSVGLMRLFALLHPLAEITLTVILLATTLAARSLSDAAAAIYRPLSSGDLAQARVAVSMVVGRDTATMDTTEVARAAVETVAENTVDGVTAPLFYALIGGVPLALLYKAVNTMDSMLGYKNERYLWFGRAAARLDDAANWLPARLTVPVMLIAVAILRLNTGAAMKALSRDGQKHPSPNSGLAEAVTAGALGVTLGGQNCYGGRISERPRLWEEGRPAEANDTKQAAALMWLTSALFAATGLVVRALIRNYL